MPERVPDENEAPNIQGNTGSPYEDLRRMVDEQQELAKGGPEVDLIHTLDSIDIPIEDRTEFIRALQDTALVETKAGRDSIKNLLNIDNLNQNQMQRLIHSGAKDKLNEVIALRLHETLSAILPQESLRPENIRIVPELSDQVSQDPMQEIQAIISDPEVSANQGMMQNVLVSERSPYVLKILKTDLQDKDYARDSLAHFERARQVLPAEFFPKQIGFELLDPPRVGTLQEKVNLDTYQVLNANNEPGQLLATLSTEQNKAIFNSFLAGFDVLYQQGVTMDLLGDNVLWRIDEQGQLDIKIVDSGMFESKYENATAQQNIAQVRRFVDQLRLLIK